VVADRADRAVEMARMDQIYNHLVSLALKWAVVAQP
jgi:hypothetical protein